ncbi:hypothetical protein D7V83_10915 [bacterium 0.1xD8-71]|nr:hypothetical protein D7V83_10915 [bacterium 0.1xD8-71]
MKRGKIAAVVFVTAILLTACGRESDGTVTTGEIVVPEMSSGDLLVNSLEYLLQDEEQEDIQEQEVSADTKDSQEKLPGAVAFTVYYSNGTCDGLNSRTEEAEELTAEVLIAALARHNIVSLDTKVLSFHEEEKEGEKVLYLDLSTEMDNYLDTMTKEAKDIIIDSIASTFLENYDADMIQIQIAGKPLHQSVTLDQAQDGEEV